MVLVFKIITVKNKNKDATAQFLKRSLYANIIYTKTGGKHHHKNFKEKGKREKLKYSTLAQP